MATLPSVSALQFTLLTPSSSLKFRPRLGTVVLKRPGAESSPIIISTPGLLTTTSRGVVPHLSRDNVKITEAIRWVGVPFETFLEHNPPVPTQQPGPNPLHTFLGFTPGQHVVALSARDPAEGKEMPTNSNTHVCVSTLRGVRKLVPEQWRSYVHATKPDVVVSVTDTPFTDPPYSQKRLTKSIERSTSWLLDLLRPVIPTSTTSAPPKQEELVLSPPIILPLAGLTSSRARTAFSETLMEPLYGPEKEALKPRELQCLDEGVSGYVMDLEPLRIALSASTSSMKEVTELFKASLGPLPETKLRMVTTPKTPHDMLHLINEVGIDLFDARWVQEAAGTGVALNFMFPAPSLPANDETPGTKKALGHNLYSSLYTHDFSSLSSSSPSCPCGACSPVRRTRIFHGVDDPSFSGEPEPVPEPKPAFTRAYMHHLLHTHEMSAHSLLAMHNLTVLDAFFSGVREVIGRADPEVWDREVRRFEEVYDENFAVLREARESWREVDMARGKGRLAREREKELKTQTSPVELQAASDAELAQGMEGMAVGELEPVVDAVDREVPLGQGRVKGELAEKGVEK